MAVTKGAVPRITGGRLAAWGGASLGFVMGTLGWYFVRRFGADQFTATSLSVTIGRSRPYAARSLRLWIAGSRSTRFPSLFYAQAGACSVTLR
jgi:hypothetical protein